MKKFLSVAAMAVILQSCSSTSKKEVPQPNVLWISCEDITTMIGAYSDANALTPYLDEFAQTAVRYDNAFATAPVCSPSRSCIITGVQAVSLGSQHLRSEVSIPEIIVPFPKYLRKAGYYCTNRYKEDYSFVDSTIWDESSHDAHWRNRGDGQPFFAVFNLGITHQSQVFGDDEAYAKRISNYVDKIEITDPDEITLPPYYPDTEITRELWARYYTNITIMDYQFHGILQQLEEDGLADETIVFFFADHGTGMPRAKRAVYDSGLKIPLLIHVPAKYRDRFHFDVGGSEQTMVSFVDFAPTMLSIAGLEIPDFMQGRPFISTDSVEEVSYVFGTSDRVDEAYELTRTVRSEKYRYIRNYFPHLPLLQPNFYTDQSMIMDELFRVQKSQPDHPAIQYLFQPHRQPEELYDVAEDPYEVNNLASNPDYEDILLEHREELNRTINQIFDTGLMPEPYMTKISEGTTPYEAARDEDKFPLDRALDVADLMLPDTYCSARLMAGFEESHPLLRYWTALVCQAKNLKEPEILAALEKLTDDPSPVVRVEAARTLVKAGNQSAINVIISELKSENVTMVLFAARAFEESYPFLDKVPEEVYRIYQDLEKQTEGKWYGHDLYAFWALREVL